MPIAELVLDNPTQEFDRFYLKVTDRHTNLVIYSVSINESSRLLKEVGHLPGLYILQAADSTLYVGQSKALGQRLKTHRARHTIGFHRILALVRDQSLAHYLDYAEAKIYQELQGRGFRLDQSPLSGSLLTKRSRLVALDKEHVRTADDHVHQFLNYAVALGLVKAAAGPTLPEASSPIAALPSPTRAQAMPAAPATKQKSVKLVVKDPGGHAFQGPHSAAVFIAALRYLGLDRLAPLGLTLGGHPLLQQGSPQRYSGEHKLVDGYYVNTHSSNKDKVKLLRRAAAQLQVALTVEDAAPAAHPPR
jgi:hypothetical protein